MSNPAHRTSRPASNRATLIMIAVAVLFVVMPALFWHGTWFGRTLTDEELTNYLADKDKPRKAQHALAQISERMSRGDPSVQQWYPQIVSLSDHPLAELRLTVAWVMGQDNGSEVFHHKLLDLLEDPELLVRRNAALSLGNFGDARARPVLQSMLRPYVVKTPHSGILTNRLTPGDAVDQATLLARVSVEGQEEPGEIRSPLPGLVEKRLFEDGTAVDAGDEVMVIAPGAEHVFQALRGLYLVGAPEDLEDVRRFLRPQEEMPPRVSQQARLTAEEIRKRAER